MAEEIVYADLNIPGASSSSRPPQQSQHLSSPPYPWWRHIAVGVGWAGTIILTIAVIVLGTWVSHLHVSCEGRSRGALNSSDNKETGIINSTECSSHMEDFQSHLKSILCEPHNGSLAEGPRCKLCPNDWRLHGDKCYWLSKEKKAWNPSRDDCSRRSSRMLVIQTQEEMNFTQEVIQGESYVWIGLNLTARGGWTWVDGSLLDPARFSVVGSAEGNSCGRLKGNQIQSETCGTELKWICQKEAAMI